MSGGRVRGISETLEQQHSFEDEDDDEYEDDYDRRRDILYGKAKRRRLGNVLASQINWRDKPWAPRDILGCSGASSHQIWGLSALETAKNLSSVGAA